MDTDMAAKMGRERTGCWAPGGGAFRFALVIAAIFWIAGTPVSDAKSVAFTPYNCSSCPTMTSPISWAYDGHSYHLEDTHPPSHVCNGNQCYARLMDEWRRFWANRYVQKVEFQVGPQDWNTQLNVDRMKLTSIWGGGYNLIITGFVPNGTWLPWYDLYGWSLQAVPIFMNWKSDGSISEGNVRLKSVRVCCSTSPGSADPYISVPFGARNTGVLLATDDVVYFKVDTGTTGSASDWITFMLYPESHAKYQNYDFDLYVRCGQKPTPNNWTLRGFRSGSEEWAISRQQPSGCGFPDTWWVAVHSYSGRGEFNLVVSTIKASMVNPSLLVGVAYNATSQELDWVRGDVMQGLRKYFGATEGQHHFPLVGLYNDVPTTCKCGLVDCDICYVDWLGPAGQTYACDPSDDSYAAMNMILMRELLGPSDGHTLVHELGHAMFCQTDEHIAPGCGLCEHSLVDAAASSNNFCVASNHGLVESGCPPNPYDPTWSIPSSVLWRPSTTPDPYNYDRFLTYGDPPGFGYWGFDPTFINMYDAN